MNRFIDLTIGHTEEALANLSFVNELPDRWSTGRIDPRIAILIVIFLPILFALDNSLLSVSIGALLIFGYMIVKGAGTRPLVRSLIVAFFFGLLPTLPATLNVFADGHITFPIATFDYTHRFLIWTLPRTVGLTAEGTRLTVLITMKVFAISLTVFSVLSLVPLRKVIVALRWYRVPLSFIAILILSYDYLIILLRTVVDFGRALAARTFVRMGSWEAVCFAGTRLSIIFNRSVSRYTMTTRAMEARGFTGTIPEPVMRPLKVRDALELIPLAFIVYLFEKFRF